MFLSQTRGLAANKARRFADRSRCVRQANIRPRLEALEDRTLLAVTLGSSGLVNPLSEVLIQGSTGDHLVLTGPATSVIGQPFFLVVNVVNASGEKDTSYAGTIHFTSSDGLAVLPADFAFTTQSRGTHTFVARLNSLGEQTISAQDTSNASISGSTTDTVGKSASSTLVTSSTIGSSFGQSITFTAKVKRSGSEGSTPLTGTVDFIDLSTGTDLGTATLKNQVAEFSTSALGAGTDSITAIYEGDANYTGSSASTSVQVTPAALTVTANDASKVYGAGNPDFSVHYTGFVLGQGPADLGGSLAFATTATAASHAGSYSVTPEGLTSSNYAITYLPGKLAVLPAALSIQAANQSKVYGAALPDLTASYSGFVNGDTPASLTTPVMLSTSATNASHVGSYGITATGATSPDYDISFLAGVLTVTPAPLIIHTRDASKVFGAPLPVFTTDDSGFVLGQGPEVIGGTLVESTPATASSSPGNYPIVPSGLTSSDYALQFVNGTLSIDQAGTTAKVELTISAGIVGEGFLLSAVVTPDAPGAGTPTGTVTFLENGTALGTATLAGGKATLGPVTLPLGNHDLTAVYNGDVDFTASTSPASPVQINNPAPTLTSLSITSAAEGSTALTLTLSGRDFMPGILVNVDGAVLRPLGVDGGSLDVAIPASLLAEAGTLPVSVINPGPGGGASNVLNLTVTDLPLTGFQSSFFLLQGRQQTGVVASFTDANPEARATDFTARIEWGDGQTGMGTVEANGRGGFDVRGSHSYALEDTYDVTVTIEDVGGSSQSVASTAIVLNSGEMSQLMASRLVQLQPGQSEVTAELTGLDDILISGGATSEILFAGIYRGNPTTVSTNGTVFYETRVNHAGGNDTLVVTFTYPASATGTPTLEFYDPRVNAFVPFRADPRRPEIVDTMHHTITVVFDRASFPSILDIHGTVFTIVLPPPSNTQPTPATIKPPVAVAFLNNTAADPADFSRETTFLSSSQLSLALTPSSDTQATTSRATLSSGVSSGGDEEDLEDYFAFWTRMLGKDFFLDLLQTSQAPTEASEAALASRVAAESSLTTFSQAVEQLFLEPVTSQPAPTSSLVGSTSLSDQPLRRSSQTDLAPAKQWAIAAALAGLALAENGVDPEARRRRLVQATGFPFWM